MGTRRSGSGVQAWRRRNAATERSVDAAVAQGTAARLANVEALVAEEKRRAALWAEKPAVDADELVVGRWALDRRRRSVGRIVRVNPNTVTLRDRTPLEWRAKHGDIIGTRSESDS